MSVKLKEDIESTWGPYSQQAMAYKALLKRLEIRSGLKEAPPTERAVIEPVHVAKLTATYFLTRGVIIVSAWLIFLILFLGITAGALWYVGSEVQSSSQTIRLK
ncbi:hypothetical protein CMI47_18130 [Candidatus Pacearchaeota archaeon]|nr:hypothetical protein [Candidatus Pacearchaeota archaeon]|tara:strand:+ start:1241 stop:1552 length:312 start_codon:yes stop_codon:yes gene_type:complete